MSSSTAIVILAMLFLALSGPHHTDIPKDEPVYL